MEDISKKIGELLSDPSAMQQIKELAGMFSRSQESSGSVSQPPVQQSIPVPVQSQAQPSADPDMIGMMMKLAPVLGSVNREVDSTRLLRALRPFLHEERSKRLDGAIRLLGIMKLLPVLKGMGFELF